MINLIDPITFVFKTILQFNVPRISVEEKINVHSISNILILYKSEYKPNYFYGANLFFIYYFYMAL